MKAFLDHAHQFMHAAAVLDRIECTDFSQFAADFVKNLPRYMGNDDRVPELKIQNIWLYVSGRHRRSLQDVLRESHAKPCRLQRVRRRN